MQGNFTHTRILASALVALPGFIDFIASELVLRVRYTGVEASEVLRFKSIDATHWVKVNDDGSDGPVWHSAQAQDAIQNFARHGELLGLRAQMKGIAFEIGNLY